ncbi:chondroitinase-B domain-containing protein [Microvirga aerophila]|uniref:chondroitinase-B domain-containing protein n=1 Tax=Microvirga aerophila TaxID=670291 RepID=UPI0013B41FAA|nr:chondroitinase-B domain-containing protein [Microvirga aerophila]
MKILTHARHTTLVSIECSHSIGQLYAAVIHSRITPLLRAARSRNLLASILTWVTLLATHPSLAQHLAPEAAQSAISLASDPQILLKQDQLTLQLDHSADTVALRGRCADGTPVVVSGRSLAIPITAECREGQYLLQSKKALSSWTEILATQLMPDMMLVARSQPSASVLSDERSSLSPDVISQVIVNMHTAGTLVLKPGYYDDALIEIAGGSRNPLLLDGQGRVTFTGNTRINVRRGNVALRGLKFERTGPGTINVAAPGFRLSDSHFESCGDSNSTFGHCIILHSSARDAEIDFNIFAHSPSMTIKVRAGVDTADEQPVSAYIHHNRFAFIERRADNGQEPIQIAGPNGGGAGIDMHARIEHNVFFRAGGDREAISLKAHANIIRWNIFKDMDAAPTIRGGNRNSVSDNILIHTRPIRVAGPGHVVSSNTILCPRSGPGIILSNGSPAYGAAIGTRVSDNFIVTKRTGVAFMSQESNILRRAENNIITRNRIIFYQRDGNSAVGRAGNDDFQYLLVNTVQDNTTEVDQQWFRVCAR